MTNNFVSQFNELLPSLDLSPRDYWKAMPDYYLRALVDAYPEFTNVIRKMFKVMNLPLPLDFVTRNDSSRRRGTFLLEDLMLGTRVILADDHTLMLDALTKLLVPEFEVVGTFSDGCSLVEGAPGLKPDVIVLDIGMSKMDGLKAGRRLKKLIPGVKLIYLTMNQDPELAAEAFRLGASGYLLKNSSGVELVDALRKVARGNSYVTPLLTEDIIGSPVNHFKNLKRNHRLTPRQKEVLQLLTEGRSMKEAAFILKLSPRTVAFHKYVMMEHLQIKSSAELIQYALNSPLLVA